MIRLLTQRRSWALVALLLVFTCCSEGDSAQMNATMEWPPGTVLVCAGDPIRAEEVDPIAEALRPLGPKFTLPHLRRLALTNVRFPLAAGRARAGAELREEARAAADAFYRSVSGDGPLPEDSLAGDSLLLEGGQATLGIPLWVLVQGLELGSWSKVSELPGQFMVVLLEARDGDLQPQRERFTVRVASFPYVEEPNSLAASALDSTLVVVDPDWEPIVPGYWRYQMLSGDDSGV